MRMLKPVILILIINPICFGDPNNDQNAISDINSGLNQNQNIAELRKLEDDFKRMYVDLNKLNGILVNADPNIVLEEYPGTNIETEPNIIKGFPCIFKIRVKNRSYVSKFSLFDESFDIAVIFRSKEKNKLFIVRSRGPTIEESLKDEHGRIVYTRERGLSQIVMSQKDSRAMLLDISSLRIVSTHSTNFSDIPPGDYTVYAILFDDSRTLCKVSNTISVRLIEPTETEKIYLKEAKDNKKWSEILRENLPISKIGIENLTPQARKQMEFHLLLSDILSSKLSLKDMPIEKLQAISVPDYLLPEKESLIYELKLVSGKIKEDDKGLTNFIDKHLELKWRFDDIKSKGGDFLYQKVEAEKGKL
jgi:hypothetical protein